MAEAPLTCIQPMQGRWVHSQEFTESVVWWKGENGLFLVSS